MKLLPHILLALAFTASLTVAPVEITPPDLRGAQQPQAAIGASGEINIVFGRDGKIYHDTGTGLLTEKLLAVRGADS